MEEHAYPLQLYYNTQIVLLHKKLIFVFEMRKLILVVSMYFVKLFDIRIDADLIQEEVAKILGVTQENYSRWETGKEFIPLNKLNILCNYFHVSMDYALGLDENKTYKEVSLDKNIIGKRLREFRHNIGITQKELAKILNTTQSTISAYERGHTLILASFAYELAKKYNLSLDWLVSRSNTMFISKK